MVYLLEYKENNSTKISLNVWISSLIYTAQTLTYEFYKISLKQTEKHQNTTSFDDKPQSTLASKLSIFVHIPAFWSW